MKKIVSHIDQFLKIPINTVIERGKILLQSESKIDAGFICCTTCKYWIGYTEYQYPSILIIDSSSKGKCVKTYLGEEIMAMGSCTNWTRRYY